MVKDAAVYPRTGGGNANTTPPASKATGLSPHGRGKLNDGDGVVDTPRSIPARAGETLERVEVSPTIQVYPRTGGGNYCWP